MLRLKRLKIGHFRHVIPGTELLFGPTFNVVLGRNGTGKTTLLKLVSAIIEDDLSDFDDEDEGYHIEYELVDSEGGALVVEIVQPPISSPFDDRYSRQASRPMAAGSVQLQDESGYRRWTIEGLRAIQDNGAAVELRRSLAGVLFRFYFWGDLDGPSGSMDPSLDFFLSNAWIGRLDEAAESFERLRVSAFLSGAEDQRGHMKGGPVATSLARDFDQWIVGDASVETNSLSSPVLASFAARLGFESVTLRFTVSESTPSKRQFDEPDFLFQRADKTIVRHDRLSFGQQRMLALLWSCEVESEVPTIADELVNGLHHEWIETIMRETLADKQSFLATQNPLLLDYVPVESASDAMQKFVRCTVQIDPEGHERMCWRNLSESEAQKFVRSLDAGVQHVSEILRDEGLW